MLRYIERGTGAPSHAGPAWIARVRVSRSGQTVYFNGMALQKAARGSHFNIETGDYYWISGPKRNGGDRHRFGSGKVAVEAAALAEYLQWRGLSKLPADYIVTDAIAAVSNSDIARLKALLNATMSDS